MPREGGPSYTALPYATSARGAQGGGRRQRDGKRCHGSVVDAGLLPNHWSMLIRGAAWYSWGGMREELFSCFSQGAPPAGSRSTHGDTRPSPAVAGGTDLSDFARVTGLNQRGGGHV